MAAIKAREAEVRAAVDAGGLVVEVGPFNMQQLGLSVAVVDKAGRIWRLDGSTLTRVFPAPAVLVPS